MYPPLWHTPPTAPPTTSARVRVVAVVTLHLPDYNNKNPNTLIDLSRAINHTHAVPITRRTTPAAARAWILRAPRRAGRECELETWRRRGRRRGRLFRRRHAPVPLRRRYGYCGRGGRCGGRHGAAGREGEHADAVAEPGEHGAAGRREGPHGDVAQRTVRGDGEAPDGRGEGGAAVHV